MPSWPGTSSAGRTKVSTWPGLKVVVVTTASDTLGFGGTLAINPEHIRSVVIVDRSATPRQREALVQFASRYARHAGEITKVVFAPIDLSVDHFEVVGRLEAGNYAQIETRKLGTGDCVCSNEMTFYPPLNDVKNASARPLRSRPIFRFRAGNAVVEPEHAQCLPGEFFVLDRILFETCPGQGDSPILLRGLRRKLGQSPTVLGQVLQRRRKLPA